MAGIANNTCDAGAGAEAAIGRLTCAATGAAICLPWRTRRMILWRICCASPKHAWSCWMNSQEGYAAMQLQASKG